MVKALFKTVHITGLHTTVGPMVKRIDDELELFGNNQAQVDRIKKSVGLNQRMVVDDATTTLDLCAHSANRLIEHLEIGEDDLDAVVFVTQTPDHFQPCNAAILHGRLGLSKSVGAFDVNLGCSGFVYGLYVASCMIETGGCSRILLLAGDTMSRCVNERDRATRILFGDAGSATLVTRAPVETHSWFILHSDGRSWDAIQIPAGGFRRERSAETAQETCDDDGNVRCANDLFMDGAEVFNFSIREEPQAIREILDFAGVSAEEVDYVVFHQANKYIIGNIARRLKLPKEKVPCETVGKYGNQSSASIPATICDALEQELLDGSKRMILSGFGVGLSWASAFLEMGKLELCCLEEYPGRTSRGTL